MRSGGNSSSLYLIWKNELPKGINNLRIGESFMLGNDTAYGEDVPGTVRDVFSLEAQIIELQEKPSVPIGEVGVDGFGIKPDYEDRGLIKRAIIAIGKQDIDPYGIYPLDKDIDVLGSSSDHLILDVTRSGKTYKVGDVISFEVVYSGLLKAVTSKYVTKVYR
jgi:predicted amino acid racemase